ncbi:MAG: hypothetical protein OXI35_00130 [Gemmatimonadota bacterium]|nr:hypothetical protein [Gemmatimonadota bacterium]
MTTIPTECEVALLRLRASTYCSQCADCKRVAQKQRQLADQDAKRCRVVLTQLVQRELSVLCTDAFFASEQLSDELSFAHPDAGVYDGERAVVAGTEAFVKLEDIYKRLRALLNRAIQPSEKAQEWLALHIDGDTTPGELCREITASDCTLGRLEP